MNWLLFLKYENGKYEIKQAGSNIVPTEAYDKVLPTTERVARQSEKVYFDGEVLRLKEGETLMTIDELNLNSNANEFLVDTFPSQEIYDVQ
ncbi:hypothetical protein MUA82_05740 [Staphylococcus simulans]|uniref:hypothetical protein n=1 Tax=Staphylococcus simulans TaxID=1286 RepID=UPI000D1D5852|nr:hypothetical protein [Staphylococcus simulans]PTJ25047.1 hypothetical protein BU039_00295 [Staphylococcus simulans]UXR53576.1 hypothetical protein MUA82_05740 [Staphylococcus simulans]